MHVFVSCRKLVGYYTFYDTFVCGIPACAAAVLIERAYRFDPWVVPHPPKWRVFFFGVRVLLLAFFPDSPRLSRVIDTHLCTSSFAYNIVPNIPLSNSVVVCCCCFFSCFTAYQFVCVVWNIFFCHAACCISCKVLFVARFSCIAVSRDCMAMNAICFHSE